MEKYPMVIQTIRTSNYYKQIKVNIIYNDMCQRIMFFKI